MTTHLNTPSAADREITVTASDRLFEELAKNDYSFVDLISELIDNSIAGCESGKAVQVEIRICRSKKHPDKEELSVKDNGQGIPFEILGEALSLATIETDNPLNEHGVGMKQAVVSMGTLKELVTKTSSDRLANRIGEFKFGTFAPDAIEVPWRSGTLIRIHELSKRGKKVPESFKEIDKEARKLGARYRRYLSGGKRGAEKSSVRLAIKIEYENLDDGESEVISVEPFEPLYYNPETKKAEPRISRRSIRGRGWEVELTYGRHPETNEMANRALGRLHKPKRGEPYYPNMENQGFDLIFNNRIITFHQFDEIFDKVKVRHNRYNRVRGEIVFKKGKGFYTNFVKNRMADTEQYQLALKRVEQELAKEKLFEPEHETSTSEYIHSQLKKNRGNSVHHQYPVAPTGGKIDIYDEKLKEGWEIKKGTSNFEDIFQLFAYMSFMGPDKIKKGYLVSRGHGDSTKHAVNLVKAKYGIDIDLEDLAKYAVYT